MLSIIQCDEELFIDHIFHNTTCYCCTSYEYDWSYFLRESDLPHVIPISIINNEVYDYVAYSHRQPLIAYTLSKRKGGK